MGGFKEKYGPWALVTGASSGLGEEFARGLAERGLNLVLVARRKDRLDSLAQELAAAHGVEARAVPADLSELDSLETLKAATEGMEIGLLINSAGFTNTGPVLDNEMEDEVRLLHVNCRAPLMLAKEYGTAMKARGRGGILFLSSALGFMPVPLWSQYAASKAYNLLLAEGMAVEMEGTGVDIMAFCPGGTRTEFLDVAQLDSGRLSSLYERVMFMDAPEVVAIALNKLGKKTTVIAGLQNNLMVLSGRITPRKVLAKIGLSFIAGMQGN